MMPLSKISEVLDGEVLLNDKGGSAAESIEAISSATSIAGVTIDSRGDCRNQLFVALKGERFDAHNFVQQAELAGAVAAIVEQKVDVDLPLIKVENTHQALKTLAAWWRAQFAIPVVAVTGSVGKTSVKEMLRCIFSEMGKGLVTKGNLNNEIGLPLTLLQLDSNDRYAIVEMGMNQAGEIARLSQIAKPTIAMINNAAAAHLEGLGSIAAVASAKGEIFQGLSPDGVGIINADDEHADLWRDLLKKHSTISFGLNSKFAPDVSADYQLSNQGLTMQVRTPKDKFEVTLKTLGKHNVYNTLAAVAVAFAANIPVSFIRRGLANYRPIDGRLKIFRVKGLTIIDDTYNANPASMAAAVEVLAQFNNTTLIVGDMAEIGDAAAREHRRIGMLAKENGVKKLLACGEFSSLVIQDFKSQSYECEAQAYANQQELIEALSSEDFQTGAVLIKGSRSAEMEKVLKAVMALVNARTSNNSPTNLPTNSSTNFKEAG